MERGLADGADQRGLFSGRIELIVCPCLGVERGLGGSDGSTRILSGRIELNYFPWVGIERGLGGSVGSTRILFPGESGPGRRLARTGEMLLGVGEGFEAAFV